MAAYKVPQDVEAEDKLLGPLTFRQFIYLIITASSLTVAFFLFRVFPPLGLIPLPISLLFGTLALPLRKDQPMETYILAIFRFYLKPKQRLWNPDGTITYVEITAPKLVQQQLAKEFSGETAKERLDYLARVMDSRGWALKGLEEQNSTVAETVVAEAQSAVDVLDEDAALSKSFDTLIAQKDQQRRQEVIEHMQQAQHAPAATPAADDTQSVWSGTAQAAQKPDDEDISLHYDPYPSSIHQKVVHPLGTKKGAKKGSGASAHTPPAHAPTSAVPPAVAPDIIRLADNNDLSISAIAHEAHRIAGKLEDDGEVVVKLH